MACIRPSKATGQKQLSVHLYDSLRAEILLSGREQLQATELTHKHLCQVTGT